MLEVKGISASYGRIQALDRVSLSVPTGRIVALLGTNGAGKTTTLNCISRLVDITEGSILFQGEPIERLSSDTVVARGISQVPEGREIFAEMSVLENLELGAHVRSNRNEIASDLDRIFDYFPRLKERARQQAGTLSGGEQQMLLIARALMAKPKLLLFDEPSLGLSPIMVEQIFEVVQQLHREGVTILLVEQNVRIALSVSDYAYILENGEIVLHGPSTDLAEDDGVQRAYLGG